MQPKITVIKAEGARYKLNFESDCGTNHRKEGERYIARRRGSAVAA
jgi:hypothetical protein